MNAGPGHNLPPSDESVFLSELQGRHGELLDRRKALVEAADRVPTALTSSEEADKAANFIKQIITHEKTADSARTDEKGPYLERGRWVDGFFKTTAIEGVAAVKKTVNDRLTAYQRKVAEDERRRRQEEERRQREEAQRVAEEAERQRRVAEEAAKAVETEADLEAALQAEEEAAVAKRRLEETRAAEERASRRAEAPAADLSRHRTSAGAVSSLRSSWKCTDYDPATVDLNALRLHFSPADIQKAIRGFIRAGGHELRGATIEEVQEARVS